MIYLIGGSPRCGKTTFSQMLAQKKRIPWFSIDLVASIVSPYMSKKEKEIMLPMLNVCTVAPKLLLRAEIQRAKTVWPGVQHSLLSLVKHKQDAVIEGVHLFPDFIRKLETMKGWESIRKDFRVLFLIKRTSKRSLKDSKKAISHPTGFYSASKQKRIWITPQK